MILIVCSELNPATADEPTESPRTSIYKLEANRSLTPEEMMRLNDLMTIFTNKEASVEARSEAAWDIGYYVGHTSTLKPLVGVVEDTNEPMLVRDAAVTAISRIADKSIMPILIKFLEDPERSICWRADRQLGTLTEEWVGYDCEKDSPEERAREAAKWRRWWEAHKNTFVPKRNWVLSTF